MVKPRWAPGLAVIVLAVAAGACSDGHEPPAAPTVNLSPPTVGAVPPQSQPPPSLPDWDKDSVAPSADTR